MATTSTPSLNRTTSAAPHGAEGEHSPAPFDGSAEPRVDQAMVTSSHGYGESPDGEAHPASENELPAVPEALRAERQRSNQLGMCREHPLLIGSQDQGLITGHVVRLC